jgi:nucleoside-diphosphate-sugar epimerase
MIFVTGGSGFLGSHLLRRLVENGEQVRALKRNLQSHTNGTALNNRVEWVEGDVMNTSSLEKEMSGCEQVYHCAAKISFLPDERDEMMKLNVEGTANVVNTALATGVKKLLHVSSVAAIGRSRGTQLVNEETQWEDGAANSNYAISKFLAEREVWRGVAEGLDAVIVNPSLIIGPGNWNAGSPAFFKEVWKGLRFYTGGATGMVDADDVVTLMIKLMNSDVKNERFIIDAGSASFKDFFFMIADELNKKRPAVKVDKWMTEIFWRMEMIKYRIFGRTPLLTRETARISAGESLFDNSKIKKATAYEFIPVMTTIQKTARKFLEEVSGNS